MASKKWAIKINSSPRTQALRKRGGGATSKQWGGIKIKKSS